MNIAFCGATIPATNNNKNPAIGNILPNLNTSSLPIFLVNIGNNTRPDISAIPANA